MSDSEDQELLDRGFSSDSGDSEEADYQIDQDSGSREEEEKRDDSYKLKASKWGKNKQDYYQESDSEASENIQDVLDEAKTLREQLGVQYKSDQFYNPSDLAFKSSKKSEDQRENEQFQTTIEVHDEVTLVKNLKKRLLSLPKDERDSLALKHFPEIPAIFEELESNLEELEETREKEKSPALQETNNCFLRDFFQYKKLTLMSYVSSLSYYLWHISKGELPHDHPVAAALARQKENLEKLLEHSSTVDGLLQTAEHELERKHDQSEEDRMEEERDEESEGEEEDESDDSYLEKVMKKRGEKREQKVRKARMLDEMRADKRRGVEAMNTAQEEGFRPISGKILKNRGLMRQRSKKEKAISRVKHRTKYAKALYKLKVKRTEFELI